ncbi:MAG: hypothetical protein RSE41_02595 [Clostridia bacterium]
MESFINNYRYLKNTNSNINTDAIKYLYDNFFINKNAEKIIEIDDTDQELLLKKINGGLPIAGMIYTFLYDKPINIIDKNINIKAPIIMCTKFNTNYLEGIDFNLMPENVRLLFLELYYNMYKSLFINIESNLENNINVLNLKFIESINSGKLRNIFDYIYNSTGYNIKICYRKYNTDKIKNIHFIELNYWKYIPFYIPKDVILGIDYKTLYKKIEKQ